MKSGGGLKLLPLRVVVLLVVPLALLLAQGPAADAALIMVTTTDDELNSDGDCSLSEAIQSANTDTAIDACFPGSGADTIILPAGTYTLGIAGAGENSNASGDLDITTDLTINGASAAATIVDGGAIDRVFHITGGFTVEMSGLTIQNGRVTGAGGGIYSSGTLTLNSVTVTGNTTVCCDGDVQGGGIRGGLLTLNDSIVADNSAYVNGGGIYVSGLSINNSTIENNTSRWGSGGGIYRAGGTISNSTVSGNTARYTGGIYVGSSSLTISNSTISGNTANQFGGGIRVTGSVGATVVLNNSTISGNADIEPNVSQPWLDVGGIYNGATVNFTVRLKNTILANNSPNECSTESGQGITSNGYNLIEGACRISGDLTGNIRFQDPVLGPLFDNGGLTETHALLAGSPAIDAGSLDCPPPYDDQRGAPRPFDGGSALRCDIGAYEFGGVPGVGSEAEALLAAKYAPLLYLVNQSAPCNNDGDPYDPEEIGLVLGYLIGDPLVVLEQNEALVKVAPLVEDVYLKDGSYNLDYPGNPRNPTTCVYETNYNAIADVYDPVAYAHMLEAEDGSGNLVLQYWFFYYFNDWNNNHEGDWEMIQLEFTASSAEEALQDEPWQIAYSQHGGGHRLPWNDEMVSKTVDSRPIVYVASGSHANYFRADSYLGLFLNGEGLGCDRTAADRPVQTTAVLLPNTVSGSQDPFAWLYFLGYWGERERLWPFSKIGFDSVPGPILSQQWTEPVAWRANLRDWSSPAENCSFAKSTVEHVENGAVETIIDFLDVAIDQQLMRISSFWPGSEVSMSLESPSGAVFDANTTDPSVTHEKGTDFETYDLENPEPGFWIITLEGTSLPSGGQDVTVIASFVPEAAPDADMDSVADTVDNCLGLYNPSQLDTDGDSLGNACDLDDDGDGLTDVDEINLYSTDPLLADTDADGLNDYDEVITHGTDPLAPDTDSDGCGDGQELGLDVTLGGLRDPLNPWDWYDVNQDGVIDIAFDILGVIDHWQPLPGGAPPYDVRYDRGPSAGPNPWNMTAPDGVIDLPFDILGVIDQWSPLGCT